MPAESLAARASFVPVLYRSSLQQSCEIDHHQPDGSNELLPEFHENPPMKAVRGTVPVYFMSPSSFS